MLGLVLTRKQRLLDLYIALGMQVVALIVASEMQRLAIDFGLPLFPA